jgi:hypothetical protein
MRIWPQDGLLAIFPSWLYHWVHPYAGQTPRIVVSFNVAVGVAANERRESQAAGDMPVLASRAL